MSGRILQDEKEFMDIVMGRLRKDLLGFLRRGAINIFPGKGRGISIPIDSIHIPRLSFADIPEDADTDDKDKGDDDGEGGGTDPGTGPDIGIGQGPGKPGTDLGPVDGEDGEDGEGKDGEKKAGRGRGHDTIEVEIPEEDFANLFKELLELPRIEPKGHKSIRAEERRYTDIRKVGPDSLLHKKRTMKAALRRQMAEGTYDPNRPRIIPIREDKRYRVPDVITKPKNNALLIFMMDVSGSMGTEERRIVRYLCALCKFWLSWNYDGLETVYIVHDDGADEVPEEEFFRTRRGGGTVISTAHTKMLEIIDKRFPVAEWNIYPVYLSDGFNWEDDDELCVQLLREKILPIVNQYSYGEVSVERPWWPRSGGVAAGGVGGFSPSGNYGRILQRDFKDDERVALGQVRSMDQVPDAIKAFFKKGK